MTYRIVNHRIEVEDPEDGLFHDFCEELVITKVITNLLTQKQRVEITVYANPAPATCIIGREELNRNLLPKLIGYGLTVIDNNTQAEFILEVLLDSEASAVQVYQHDKLGFQMVDGELVFLAHHPVGCHTNTKDQSEYIAPTKTKTSGDLKSWKKVVQDEVIGHKHLELALSIGASAPIAYLLRTDKVFAEVPVWALIGLSSTGKTTALRLMASIFGSPEEGDGLIKDLNATENAFFRMLGDDTGMPLLIDEATCRPTWDFSSIVYNLSKGKDKARCNNTGELRTRISFSGAVVISGENSLIDQSRDTPGMHARLVELTLPWTNDADHARRLTQKLRKNYGAAVRPIVETLLILRNKHPEVLEKLFQLELQRLKEQAGMLSGVDERPYNMYATVMVAVAILQNALGIRFHAKDIRRLLLEQHKSKAPERTVEERLYDYIIDAAVTHGQFFPKRSGKGKNQLLPDTLWGEYATRNMQEVLWITAETFQRFAEEAQCPNYRQFLSKMRDKGLLVDFGDVHYRQKHELGHGKPLCYCLKLNKTHPTAKQKKQPLKKRSPHPDLLREDEDDNEES